MKAFVAALGAALAISVAPARAQTPAARVLSLSFAADGTVTLKAQGVSMRDILLEWARQCGCYVVNADRLTGAATPYPLLFEHASQGAVLESLLRQAAGYVLTPRRAGNRGSSDFEVIYILPTSTAVQTTASSSFSTYSSSPAVPIATAGSPSDEIPPIQPVRTEATPATPPPASTVRPPTAGGFLPTASAPAPSAPPAPQPGTPPPPVTIPAVRPAN